MMECPALSHYGAGNMATQKRRTSRKRSGTSVERKNAYRKSGKSVYGRQKKKKEKNFRWVLAGCLILIILFFVSGRMIFHTLKSENALREALSEEYSEDPLVGAPPLDVELLTVNPYSRPGTPLEEVKNVAIHYTANPGSTAMNNRDYFEGLKDNHMNKVSSHFIVGLEGEIVQCIPTSEISYATNSRNVDTLSIECCHPDETGQFNEATYRSLVELTAYLCNRFGLDIAHVIRHYDVTGKNCPKYYVEHPDAWEQLKKDIQTRMEEKQKEME